MNNIKDGYNVETKKLRHELAKEYSIKSNIFKLCKLNFELIDNDRVLLLEVKDKDSTGIFKMPSFITDIDCGYNEAGLFSQCKFTKIDLGNTKLYNYNRRIKNTRSMFAECINLQEVNLGGLNTDGLCDTSYMFYKCKNLKHIDLSNFDTEILQDLTCMFVYCDKLENITWCKNKSNVDIEMMCTFHKCESLSSLDLSCFRFNGSSDLKQAFMFCKSLKRIRFAKTFKLGNLEYKVVNESNDTIDVDIYNI